MQRTTWNKTTIKQRITISYIIFILIPFCLLSVHAYTQTEAIQKEQTIGTMKQTLTVVKNSIEGKLNLVESISHNITYNTHLQSFLESPFQPESGSMDLYRQQISPIVYFGLVYNQVEISDIKIYMNNYSIPEGFGSFYHDKAIFDKPWYVEFMSSDSRSAWITLLDEGAYAYLQKIVSMEGEYLGISRVTMLRKDLLASLDYMPADQSDLFVKDADNRLLLGTTSLVGSSDSRADSPMDNFKLDGKLYIQDHIERIDFTVGLSKKLPKSLYSFQLLQTIGFIAAIVLAILMFYRVLKQTFVKIKASIRAMDHSIRTGFTDLIPVERNDEIGVISEKFNTLLDQINSLVNDMVKRETVHKDAQLKALQAQINPHFIYNTINLFSAKTELAGLYDVSEAFADFGQILRYNMNNQSAYATIDQEIHHVLRYIRLQKMRFGERLTINWTCEEQILQTPIIRFILQPVVENSIAHGMRNRSRLLITLDVKQNSRREIIIIISDNGAGISDTKLATLNRFFEQGTNDAPPVFAQGTGSGIGLGNINERLRLFYGDVYTIKMESAEGHFTRTLITVPIREEMGGERHA